MTATMNRPEIVDAAAARRLIADDPAVRIIDVRTGGEFANAHIPGSYNIPLDTISEHARDLAGLEHPVLLVCQSGARAKQAQGHLANAGMKGLHLLDGGMNAWTQAGGDVATSGSKVWAMERQVRFAAGTLVLTGILAGLAVPKARLLSAGVASGLIFSAVTDTCGMAKVLGKLPFNRGAGCDISSVITELRDAR